MKAESAVVVPGEAFVLGESVELCAKARAEPKSRRKAVVAKVFKESDIGALPADFDLQYLNPS